MPEPCLGPGSCLRPGDSRAVRRLFTSTRLRDTRRHKVPRRASASCLRRPEESFSDAILRLVELEAPARARSPVGRLLAHTVRNAVVQAYQRSSMLERRRLQRIAEASDHRSGVGMKIIFSRKGVDSTAGRCASPLLDGRPLSLPIPTRMPTATKYRDLSPLTAEIASDLSGSALSADRACHLDPDIDRASLAGNRPDGWRGALGQCSSSLSHLRNAGVGADDIFLFWGLYRKCERAAIGWRYAGQRFHLIFGWLQVDEVIDLGDDGSHVLKQYPWLSAHPHVRSGWPRNNAIYLARNALGISGGGVPGFGVFRRPIMLTSKHAVTPSTWSVPAWLDPTKGGVGMTYHPPARWLGDGRVIAAARGQEFVADAGKRADARNWVLSFRGAYEGLAIRNHRGQGRGSEPRASNDNVDNLQASHTAAGPPGGPRHCLQWRCA